MIKWVWIVLAVVLIFLAGYVGGSAAARARMPAAFAFGYNEAADNWNKIRVDEKGHVICAVPSGQQEGGVKK